MKKRFSFICCSLLFLLFTSCGALGSKITLGNSDKWLPANFRPAKSIMLVQIFGKPKNGVNKAMAKYLDKKYPYKYEIVSADDIRDLNGKYSDLNVYQFALVWSKHYFESGSMAMHNHYSGHGYDLNFVDRSNGRNYPKTGKGCSSPMLLFNPVVNTIVKYCHKS